ncbi:MAG: PEP-CTERM sorting domain-containing protein [Chlorobia bacterium]|nr:PEP-CTERM sorting domain-containing protein [Fimbriimonadaceae bacterium]
MILMIIGVISASVLARPDRNAFINRTVNTTAELVAEAKRDRSVMDRYMRHYGMTRSEVIAYLSTLKPSTIKEEGVYAIYSVPEGGKIKLHMERLKKGHKVFATQDGDPQIILKCGNPLTLGPKQVVALNQTPVTTTEVVADETPIEIMTEIETEVEPVLALQPVEPTYEFPVVEANPIPIIPAGGFNLLPLALGGLAFIDTGGGSSVVPEPMTMAVFGAGVALLGLRKRRRASK